jgi:hypothetical protein
MRPWLAGEVRKSDGQRFGILAPTRQRCYLIRLGETLHAPFETVLVAVFARAKVFTRSHPYATERSAA